MFFDTYYISCVLRKYRLHYIHFKHSPTRSPTHAHRSTRSPRPGWWRCWRGSWSHSRAASRPRGSRRRCRVSVRRIQETRRAGVPGFKDFPPNSNSATTHPTRTHTPHAHTQLSCPLPQPTCATAPSTSWPATRRQTHSWCRWAHTHATDAPRTRGNSSRARRGGRPPRARALRSGAPPASRPTPCHTLARTNPRSASRQIT